MSKFCYTGYTEYVFQNHILWSYILPKSAQLTEKIHVLHWGGVALLWQVRLFLLVICFYVRSREEQYTAFFLIWVVYFGDWDWMLFKFLRSSVSVIELLRFCLHALLFRDYIYFSSLFLGKSRKAFHLLTKFLTLILILSLSMVLTSFQFTYKKVRYLYERWFYLLHISDIVSEAWKLLHSLEAEEATIKPKCLNSIRMHRQC